MRRLVAMILAIMMLLCGSNVHAENVIVDETLFNVEITVPADFFDEENTQEQWDKSVADGVCKSAIVNEDGSVNIVMSKKQHKEMLEEIKQQIDEGLVELVETNEQSTLVSIETNVDYTEFNVMLGSDTVGFAEAFSAIVLYMYSALYNTFAGTGVDNATVTYINQATGEIIEIHNSSELNNTQDN